jgi:hypothetical protein
MINLEPPCCPFKATETTLPIQVAWLLRALGTRRVDRPAQPSHPAWPPGSAQSQKFAGSKHCLDRSAFAAVGRRSREPATPDFPPIRFAASSAARRSRGRRKAPNCCIHSSRYRASRPCDPRSRCGWEVCPTRWPARLATACRSPSAPRCPD